MSKATTLDVARRKLVPSEHVEQSWLFQQIRLREGKHPGLRLAFAVPNVRSEEIQRKILSAEGVKPAVPDTVFPVARFPWHGLYIEMKKDGQYARADQRAFLADLIREGYLAVVCQTAEPAVQLLDWYLGLGSWAAVQDEPETSLVTEERESQLTALALREKVFVY